jgi:N4-gp56 family major capsid protein
MSVDSAKTLSSQVTQAIKNRYYDEIFLRVAEKNLVYQQLGQLNRQIPKGENATSVFWTRWTNLPLVTAGQGEGVPTTAVALSAVNVSGTAAQYDAAVSISDLMSLQSFGDIMKAAVQRLAYNAGLSIDTVVRNTVVPGATVQVATGAASMSAVPATGVLSITELRKAIRTLQKNDAFRVGSSANSNDVAGTGGDGYWVAVIGPEGAYDLMGDTATGAWIDTNRYAGSEQIFSGEIGKLYGTRFLQTSNDYNYGINSGVVASGTIHGALVTGTDYFGVTTLQNLQTYIKDFGSGGIADPTNKIATAGWKAMFGATVLNNNFAVQIQHAVSP